MHRKAEEWTHGEGISQTALSKEGQWEWRCLSIIGDGAGQFLACEGFCPNFPKLSWKVFFVQLLPTNFLSQRPWSPLFGVTSRKRSSCVFMETLGATFLSRTTLGVIFTLIFRDYTQIFGKSNLFEMRLHPLHPSSKTTALHNSSIGNSLFTKIDLKQIYCSYSGTQNIENGFL